MVILFPEIGEVRFVPNVRANCIRILLKPFGGIRVTVPKRVDIREAMAFVKMKTDWILKAQLRIAEREKQHVVFTPETDFSISTLRKEAKEYLPQRTENLAARHGFSYNGVTVKNLKSRWGSCSATNRINLNIHLMRLPEHLSDYVILHELAHTVHKNHSKDFWQCLNKLTNDKAKQLTAEMKKYQIG